MKFRSKLTQTRIENNAGGIAFKESLELEAVSLLLTSFVSDKFYESGKEQIERASALVHAIKDKAFIAKAAIFARTKFGMRSITHVVAAELARWVKGEEWLKRAIDKIVARPDDALEILAFYLDKYEKPIPNALKKGLALSLDKFDAYQLAKYRGERSTLKMVDLFNFVHPKPKNKEQEKLFHDLIFGELKSTGENATWESKISQAGQAVAEIEDVEEKQEKLKQLKADSWKELLEGKKLGYFALLRNLRNLIEQAPDMIDMACEQLVDEKAISKSLVLPFRFDTAAKEIAKLGGSAGNIRKVVNAINDALEISLGNVPKFSGRTLIALDESGSMRGQPIEIGSLFASVLYKRNDADLLTFSEDARFRNLNSRDSVLGIAQQLQKDAISAGTNFHAIFEGLKEKYDRIFILSDQQAWMVPVDGYFVTSEPGPTFREYKERTGANPFVYSFDLAGHGSLQFPEQNVFALAGFSDKIFGIIDLLEQDRNALIKEIQRVVI